MPSDKWYYHRDKVRNGPVSIEELQRLAASGAFSKTDLVWKSGMEDWVRASEIEGLFPPEIPPPQQRPPSTPSQPSQHVEGQMSRAISTASAARSIDVFETQELGNFLPHIKIVDGILNKIKSIVTPQTLDRIDALAQNVGNIAYVLAALLVVMAFTILGIKTDSTRVFLGAIVAIPVAFLFHYTAVQFLNSGKVIIEQSPSALSSDGFLKVFALVQVVFGVIVVSTGIHGFVESRLLLAMFSSILSFLAAIYIAALALNPESVNVTISQVTSAGEEAIGILSFLAKAHLRMVAAVFGMGSVVGLLVMMYINFELLMGNEALAIILAYPVAGGVLALGLLPFFVYVIFLFSYLLIDVLRSILMLPHLVGNGRNPDTEEQ